jgi:energy-coupling factor transport system substrate-specific component
MASKAKLPLREVVLFGVLGALTFALQVVMAPLPNIEPVSLMVMLFAAVFGWKGLYPTYVFVVMEILFYGIGGWAMYYLYIWVVLFAGARLLREMEHPLGWAILSGAFGLLFGALCAIMDAFIGGVGYAVTKWVSGITFDLAHCGGNFVIALVLFVPLRKLFTKLNR